jgi:glycosyltransferase involved in cell wall biosynthesis
VAVGGEEEFTEEETTLLAEKSLAAHVKHLKRLSDEELVLAYNTAQAFIYPSLYEGFGLPLLEAMACGTPMIASKTSSIPEIAGDAAVYFNPQDLDDIRAAMESVLETGTAQSLRGRGQERARQFSWQQTAHRMLQAYQSLS